MVGGRGSRKEFGEVGRLWKSETVLGENEKGRSESKGSEESERKRKSRTG